MDPAFIDIKRAIRFFLEKRKGQDGKLVVKNVPIRMSITFQGQRLMLYAGHRVDVAKWDEKKQRVKSNTTNSAGASHQDINDRLDRLSAGINKFFRACEVAGEAPSSEQIKAELSRLSGDKRQVKKADIYEAFDTFTRTVGRENHWQTDTYEKFATLKRFLQEFDPGLTFSKLTGTRLVDYMEFLRVKKKNRNSTIDKNLSFVKWFLKWADKNGFPVTKEAQEFKPRLKGVDGSLKKVIFLTIDELKHINSLDIPREKNYLSRVRDVFVFCCFSGLRYSDVFNLKKSDDKGSFIEFVTQKTSDRLRVELNKYSREILDRYKDVPMPKDKALPVVTNQKMNEYLKELGELAGLDSPETVVYFQGSERVEETYPKYKLLSTHCARKTFVTNLIYMGVSDHVIRQWTGHKDTKSFEVYHKMVDDIKAREMAKFNDI